MYSYTYRYSRNFFAILLACISLTVSAAPKKKALEFWLPHAEQNKMTIDHSEWQYLLDKYVVHGHDSGINRFKYVAVKGEDRQRLGRYTQSLASIDPRVYSRIEQKAYWINLYNALTVKLILDNYPVESITDLGEGFFSFGPWDDEIVTIEGQTLTLNHIEHGILRPIYNDARIHYAVNCASLGCPNLSSTAYTSRNMESLLESSARAYVNHSRGVSYDNGELVVSSIYHWFKEDFGDSDKTLIAHLAKYAEQDLREKLQVYRGKIDHEYDWTLNKP